MLNCKHGQAHRVIRETGVIIYKCDFCGEELQSFLRRMSNWFIFYNFYTSRGEYYTNFIEKWFQIIGGGGVALLLWQGYKGQMPSFWTIPILIILKQALVFILGYKDYTKWKVSQREQVFGIRYSPSTVEMFNRIKNIEKKIAPKTYKEEGVLDWYKDEDIKEIKEKLK